MFWTLRLQFLCYLCNGVGDIRLAQLRAFVQTGDLANPSLKNLILQQGRCFFLSDAQLAELGEFHDEGGGIVHCYAADIPTSPVGL